MEKLLTKEDLKNIELHEYFLFGFMNDKSQAFIEAYEIRNQIIDLNISVTKENQLLSLLKKIVIKDIEAEKLSNQLESLMESIKIFN